MRLLSILVAALIAGGWVITRHPHTEANANAAVDRPVARVQEVRSISFDGKALPLARLREQLATHAGEQLDPARLLRDREALAQALARMGYLAARVAAADVTYDTAGAAYVTFEVDKGALFHLRKIEVSGPGKDTAVVTLAAGDDAIRTRLDQARQALSDGLARRGRPSNVELVVHTDELAGALDVQLVTR